jgi:hypothetical protein
LAASPAVARCGLLLGSKEREKRRKRKQRKREREMKKERKGKKKEKWKRKNREKENELYFSLIVLWNYIEQIIILLGNWI